MISVITPQIGRRKFVVGGASAASGLLLPTRLMAQHGSLRRIPTPAQTAGPFYPVEFPPDLDNDLVILRGSQAQAEGIVTHIMGRVLGSNGQPIPSARIEIWQCDNRGRYLHPADSGLRPRDKAFQGFGRAISADDGSYRFRTIRPVAYPGRTPHIHFAVTAPGRRESWSRRCTWLASR